MSKPLVIFGMGDIAELAHFYFSSDSDYEVVAFSVDGDYCNTPEFRNLPVVPFEKLAHRFPPDEYEIFVALGYAKINALRTEKYLAAKSKGYRFASYVSSRATVLNDGSVGENCLILEDNTIQPFVRIGDNVTLWSGNHVGHHSVIHDHCFIASHVVISGCVEIGESCFIGVNATLRDHIKVGPKCIVGAGSLLLADAEGEGVYFGHATERSRVPSRRLKKI